ncbi:sulfatase [Sphingobacterium phlebotomi]|uniref:Sulfatase n=2 Tax=Sphingobacterium phlebotomi TaxID=2605433 RepID=A0A5D4HFA6_9SPHI|nr:sulfatase [Sphingobacterium phlebotomi]
MNTSTTTNNRIKFLLFVVLYTFFPYDISAQQHHHKPNFVIIMADDLDVQQLSCYGGKNLETKHIDRLASEGLMFNSMIASEAMCIPTRASLLTGLYPARHGAYQNHKPVYDGLKSVVHYLGDLGYRVGLTGKDHMTKPKAIFPFDRVDGFEPNCVSPTDVYFLDSVQHYITQDSPYCLFIMSNNPHAPWTVGDPREFNPSELTLPAHWVDTEQSRTEFRKYLAEVRRLDNQVGDVLAMLEKTGQDKNTIVIFLGEQGPQFPGGKWGLYDYGQKSGMIVRWPEKVSANVETDAIVQYEDITPTLVDIAGGEAITGLDGQSFKQVLTHPEKPHREVAFGIHNNIPEGPAYPMRSIRDNKYKLILNLLPDATYSIKWMMNLKKPQLVWTTWIAQAEHDAAAAELTNRIAHKPAVEFYDLQQDPHELENLAEESAYKKLITKYTDRLQNWMKEQGDSGIDMDTKF